ncbi:A24 family peptidase [Erysipelothrix urinaevulpis]|uniref:prepilin peptidase n=1 Tax=Erysipelothrix urinaevulpis TaxID=2683717 RepID=UPI00135978DA|nr:A24 family peptidase [Erysipelothrix urinaevulpis]
MLSAFFVFGLIIGSFLGVLIIRIPEGRDFVHGHSECDFCKTQLKAIDLIPVLSFLMNKGQCRYCKQTLSHRYLILELLTGFTFALVAANEPAIIPLILNLIFVSLLIVIAYIDLDTMLIYDRFHLYLILLALLKLINSPNNWKVHILGAVVVSFPYYILAKLTKGIGMGDVKLTISAGLYLGFPNILVAFLVALIIAGIHAISMIITKKASLKTKIPYGPYLVIGFIIALTHGPALIQWYLNILF